MQVVCNKWIMIELMSFIIQVFSLIEIHGQYMMAVSIDRGWHIVSRYCICCDQLTVVFFVTTLMDCLWLNNGRIINRRQASKDSLSRLYFRDRGRDLFYDFIFSFSPELSGVHISARTSHQIENVFRHLFHMYLHRLLLWLHFSDKSLCRIVRFEISLCYCAKAGDHR